MVSIAVIDRGIGIFPEDLPRVVKKFARGQNALGSGTGLGLAIVKNLAHVLDGEVTVANRETGGAVFTVTLPIRDSAEIA